MDEIFASSISPVNFTKTISGKKYFVGVVNSGPLLTKAFELRYQVYRHELNTNLPYNESSLENDKYDPYCAHLIVYDTEQKLVIGNYRLRLKDTTNPNRKFYSEAEFNLSRLMKQYKQLCELGRACIHPDYRNGLAIKLLWKGLAEYCKYHKIQYLFGCVSIEKNTDLINKIYTYASEKNYLLPDSLRVDPHENIRGFSRTERIDINQFRRQIPPLLRAYFTMGGKIASKPAPDKPLNCFDYFMLLPFDISSKKITRFIGGK
jgi:putative hemolysin